MTDYRSPIKRQKTRCKEKEAGSAFGIWAYNAYRFTSRKGAKYFARTTHSHCSHVLALTHVAGPLKTRSLRLLFAFTLGLSAAQGSAAQSASSSGAQPTIREEVRAAYSAGTVAATKNDLKTAEAQFEKVVRLAPQIEEGHSALGMVQIRLGKLPQAIHELQKAIELRPTDISPRINLGLAYAQIGANKKAIALFSGVEAQVRTKSGSDPAVALPSYVLETYARSLAATGQFTIAISKMKAAVAASPQNAELHDALGSLHAQQQSWPSAIAEFQRAIQINPQFAAAHLHLGAALLAQQQVSPAIAELTEAAQLAPDNALVATELGKAYVANNQDERAIEAFRRAIELDSTSTEAKYQLARALQRTGHDSDAIPLLRQVVATEPKNVDAGASLGLALLLAGNAKDATPYLERALKERPGDPTAHENLAAAYLQMNEVDEAIQVLSSGLKADPQSYQLHYNLGLALKLKDDNAGAIPELEAAAKLNPSAHEPHYTLGILYMQDGRYDNAARELSLAMKLHPQDADGWATLGSLYRKMGKLPEAADALREAIQQKPDQPDSHLTLAMVLQEQGHAAEAAAERKKGADLERVVMNRQRAEVSTNTGNALLEKGQIADAVERFQEALSDDPGYARAHRGLADALERQGKEAEAAAERQKAAELEKPQP
jgi:protein O-GlcNAc transferase